MLPLTLSHRIKAEGFAWLERILGLMSLRSARWFAIALVTFLLAQTIPFLAFASDDGCDMPCCKGMHGMCCRRMHMHPSGPAFTSRDCCTQCQVWVRKSQPVAETRPPANVTASSEVAISAPLARLSWIPSPQHDAALFQRPPPSTI